MRSFWDQWLSARTSGELLRCLRDGLCEKHFNGDRFSQAVEQTVLCMPGMGSLPEETRKYDAIKTTTIVLLHVLHLP